ncbi:MAG: hypothetical protein IJ042_08250 [Butyricicoccus sp.]|nr:hypothetical protein [Butyricicoccus sp.]
MKPMESRAISTRLIYLGMLCIAPSMIASVAGIDFWLLNGAFFVGIMFLLTAMFVRTKYWRCPSCKTPLRAECAMTQRCHHCNASLVDEE